MVALPRAFHPFLGTFPRLTPIQSAAIPVLLTGRDAVLVAPAASGKTEAAVAPLCERLTGNRVVEGIGILYVVPTRALANDIETRIRGPIGTMGMRLTVRTGDRPASLAGRGTDVLVTTPESFDSLLCRQSDLFATLRAVVVDEAHLLDGTSRGDQMRVLLRRLAAWHCKVQPQRVAMTATVRDPAALGRRLFGGDPETIRAGLDRPIRIEHAPDVAAAVVAVRAEGLSKALLFCNSRRRVEEVGRELARQSPWPPERVLVHHGSLARREREDVEQAFRRWEAGLLVATTTMEQGVDIGDVDAVILVGAPDSPASFTQRVGRGCRRRTGMLAYCVPDGKGDGARFAALLESLDEPVMDDGEYIPDRSVVVQQTFSALFGIRRGVPRKALLDVMEVLAPHEILDRILDHLLMEGWIETGRAGRLVATTRLMDMGERGRIHGNIADGRTVKVVDAATGRTIGHVAASAGNDDVVSMGGRSWRVTGAGRDTVNVSSTRGEDDVPTRFARRLDVGAFHRYLPEDLA